MKIDIEKIQKYLMEIKARHHEITELLLRCSDAALLDDPWVLKGLKYSLVEIAEAMANILYDSGVMRHFFRWKLSALAVFKPFLGPPDQAASFSREVFSW